MIRNPLLAVLVAAALCAPAAAQYVSDAEPFIAAVTDRDGDKATDLIEKRPTIVNSRNSKGQTALNVAISRSDELWTRFLLGKGADPNLPDSKGDTPLIAAARVGFTDAVELLLDEGAKVDSANRMGETALIIAVQQRELPIVKLLLAKGANPDKTDAAAGYSARDYAKRDSRSREILAAIEAAKQPKSDKAKDLDLDDFKLK
jgi:ankyrin repeat protein